MYDWNQLRADDPGYPGDTVSISTAHAALSAMTVTQSRGINRIDLRDIYNALGSIEGETVINALETAGQSNPVIARALAWSQPGEDMGIDICDTEVQAVFQSLVGGAVTQQMIDSIIALASETVPKYPGLTEAHVADARRGKQ